MENAVKKKLSPKVVLLIAIALIALFVAALAYQPNEKEPPEPKVDITVTLKNIVETSDLSTSVFKYEGIVEIPDPKNLKTLTITSVIVQKSMRELIFRRFSS